MKEALVLGADQDPLQLVRLGGEEPHRPAARALDEELAELGRLDAAATDRTVHDPTVGTWGVLVAGPKVTGSTGRCA